MKDGTKFKPEPKADAKKSNVSAFEARIEQLEAKLEKSVNAARHEKSDDNSDLNIQWLGDDEEAPSGGGAPKCVQESRKRKVSFEANAVSVMERLGDRESKRPRVSSNITEVMDELDQEVSDFGLN